MLIQNQKRKKNQNQKKVVEQTSRKLNVIIILTIILNTLRCDLPIHCTVSDTIGKWEIKLIEKTVFQTSFKGN